MKGAEILLAQGWSPAPGWSMDNLPGPTVKGQAGKSPSIPPEERPARGDPVSLKEKLRSVFDSMDKDHDGRVSYKEWMRGLSKHEAVLSEAYGGGEYAGGRGGLQKAR